MIRLTLFVVKITLFSIVVLVISQIPVRSKRICDHVRDVVQHALIQKPVHWIGATFNFLEGHKAVHAGMAQKPSNVNDAEHSESDKSRLSGLLKTNH